MAKLSGKKVLMIIAKDGFRDEEYQKPRDILEREGAKITVASSTKEIAKGMLGAKVKPDMLISEVKSSDYDAVIFVGGMGSTEYWNNETAHKVAKESYEQNKLVSAICLAPVTLLNAGILKGRKATVFSSEANTLKLAGVNYTGKKVEVDGKVITGNGPESAVEFANAIVNEMVK